MGLSEETAVAKRLGQLSRGRFFCEFLKQVPMAREQVLCISWEPSLAMTRRMLLRQAGYQVISAVGEDEARSLCKLDADLLVLGHSVPQDKKQVLIQTFRKHSTAPVLSLLCPGQRKLPEATFGVEAIAPEDVIRALQDILPRST